MWCSVFKVKQPVREKHKQNKRQKFKKFITLLENKEKNLAINFYDYWLT